MRATRKGRKSTSKGKKNHTPLRRSLRQKLIAASLSTDRCTKTKFLQPMETRVKSRKRLQFVFGSTKIKSKQTKQIPIIKQSVDVSTEINQLTSTKMIKGRITKQVTCIKKRTNPLKKKPKEIIVKQSDEVRETEQKCSKDSVITGYDSSTETLRLIKTIRIKENYYKNAKITRFSDIAFLDDYHVLALDDSFLKRKQGQRICCINLEGTLVCDLLVPGYPWSVVVLSPTEAIVSMRGLRSNGLFWISIDINNKSMEITRNIPFETETYGLSYTDRSESFLVSYSGKSYMSVLNREGAEIRKIPCVAGKHYRNLIMENDDILFLDFNTNTVKIMDQKGNVISSLEHTSITDPLCFDTDCYGNIYIGNYRGLELLKFDRSGKFLAAFPCVPNVCGIGIDRTSERIVVASDNTLFVYKVDKNV